jgi:hypothetical protein
VGKLQCSNVTSKGTCYLPRFERLPEVCLIWAASNMVIKKTHTHTHSHSNTHTLTHTHSHTLTLKHTHTHSHTHTHTQTTNCFVFEYNTAQTETLEVCCVITVSCFNRLGWRTTSGILEPHGIAGSSTT